MNDFGRKFSIAIGAGILGVASFWLIRKLFKQRNKVATVKSLTLYPVKRCSGVDVQEVFVTQNGGVVDTASNIMDRSFVVMDSDHRVLDAKLVPELRLVKPALEPGTLRLSAVTMPTELVINLLELSSTPVELIMSNRRLETLDCGDEASRWFSQLTHRPNCRLVHLPNDMLCWGPASDAKTLKYNLPFKKDKVALQNLAPVNLVSQNSLDDAARQMPDDMTLDRHNLRANIVVDDVTKPYAEDAWKVIQVGGSVMYQGRECTRCPQTTLVPVVCDGDTHFIARRDEEPMTSLKKFRMHKVFEKPAIAIDLGVVTDGKVRVGDSVFV